MSQKRRDNKNRILNTGESQKANGLYVFKYTDGDGKPKFIYSWRLVETDRLPAGKRPCRPLREREREIRRDLEDGIDPIGKKMTVSQLYAKFTRCRLDVREGTERSRAQLKRLLFEDAIGSREIGGVKPSDAKEWAQRMKSKGFAYSTISNHKRSLKAAFYLAIADDCIRKNPFDFKLATVIKRDVTEREPLSREQVDALLGFMRSDAVYHRYIDEVMAAFEHVMASRPKAKPLNVDGRTGFIFLNRDGLPRVGGDYDRVFRGLRGKYAKKGKMELPDGMTPHTLRHTFCTEMAKAGMNPKALQYIMGHKDIKMTLGYYAHMDGCTAAEEMRRVAA